MTENQKFAGYALAMIGGTALLIAVAPALFGNAGTAGQTSASKTPHTSGESSLPSDRGYRIVDEEDLSMRRIPRRQLRIQVDGPKTEAELRTICQQVLASRNGLRSCNAVGFFFYLPGTDTRRHFTAGQATWAPDGKWENAGHTPGGDTSRHKLVVQVGNALGNRLLIDEAPLPESKRRRIFYELVAAQDTGVGDSEAFTLMARKYDLPEEMLFQIAGEGAAKGWSMP
jgi:hypothetical protein